MRKQDAFDVIYTHTEGEPCASSTAASPIPPARPSWKSAPSWNSAMTGCARR
ncbi:hypothetical protein WJ968_16220 [Achromobacter xylosoxidans]